MLTLFERICATAADIFTFIASGIAIFVAIFKRDKISLLMKYIISYSKRLSLSDLSAKLDKLNTLNADSEEHKQEVLNIFSEIVGQINGNKELSIDFSDIKSRVQQHTKSKKIREPQKRSLVSELREIIRVSEFKSLNK